MTRAASNAVYTFLAWLPVLAIGAIMFWLINSVYLSVDEAMAGRPSFGQGAYGQTAGSDPAIGNPNLESAAERRAEEISGIDCDNAPAYVASEVEGLCQGL